MSVYPDGALGLLFVILALMLFEQKKVALLLFIMLSYSVAQYDGIAAGVVYWVLMMLPRMGLDWFTSRGDLVLTDID
jgi:glucose dehydrogenase